MKHLVAMIGASWKEIESPIPFQRAYKQIGGDMRVLVGDAPYPHPDGTEREWRHVSFSHPDRIPSYDEIAAVKRAFVGDDSKAIMVFPPADKHVNIHRFTLHLFAPHDGSDTLPEFSGVVPGIGRTI